MKTIWVGAFAAVAIASCAGAARADSVCAWRGMGVWQCGDGHTVNQVYSLPSQPNEVVRPVTTVAPYPEYTAPNGQRQ
jgi:hypothetical protein